MRNFATPKMSGGTNIHPPKTLFPMNRLLTLLCCGLLLFSCRFVQAQTPEDLQRQIDNENFREARRASALLIQDNANKPEPFYYLGLSFLEEALIQEEPEARRALLEQAKQPFLDGIELKKKYANNYLGLGRYYAYTGDFAKAREQFAIVSTFAGEDPAVLAQMAFAYITTGDKGLLEEATTLLSRAEALGSTDATIYEALGDVWMNRGVQELPLINYQRALQQDPKRVSVHHKMGKYYMTYQQYAEALAAFNDVLALDPSFAPVYPDLGELYLMAKKYDSATEYYRKYVELRGNDRNARYRFAQFLYLSQQYDQALAQLQMVDTVTRVKMRLMAYSAFEIGNTYTEQKNEAEAKNNYNLAKENIDKLFSTSKAEYLIAKDYEYRGKIYMVFGELEKGINDVLHAVELDSTRSDLYTYLRDFYNKQRDYKGGLRFQQLATEADPSVKSNYELGIQAYYAKEYALATVAFQKVADEKSDFVPAYLFLGRAYSSIDTSSTEGLAKPYYEKVISLSEGDPVKYKKELVEAYRYMSIFEFNVQRNFKASKEYLLKLLEVDPTNEDGKQILLQVDDNIKQYGDSMDPGEGR